MSAFKRKSKKEEEPIEDGSEATAEESTEERKAPKKPQTVEEELEAVREIIGPETSMTGFYSYGEICPAGVAADCELHNQTMTVTTLREV